MNLNEQEMLAAAVDRELKQLPELRAPETLIARVMSKIERCEEPSARNISWTSWPLRWRIISLSVFATVFCLAAFGIQWLFHAPFGTSLVRQMAQNASGLDVVWNTLSVLAGAAELALQKLGSRFLILSAALLITTYFVCIGLGTMMIQTAIARRKTL
ncbi:MAG TPA: hypothetical protein VFW05_18345 [Verrucomicrobiae bacterium]|jgi:hypothetical protein|nr:hypothetical protein [Verrucomicrobiae bacterium]